jgi:hypothetical protein
MTKSLFLCALLLIGLIVWSVAATTDAPAVGSTAPEFALTTNEGKQANLKDYRGKWVVLYFYPKDFTSGCTLQAHKFQRDLAKYEALNNGAPAFPPDTLAMTLPRELDLTPNHV